ncbi:MAG TPA: hypothetical protein VF158_13965 [Longimicrobiales bacterium]
MSDRMHDDLAATDAGDTPDRTPHAAPGHVATAPAPRAPAAPPGAGLDAAEHGTAGRAAGHAASGRVPGAVAADAELARVRKFRHAAFAYLHVGLLYEAAAYVMWRRGLLPEGRGPGWLWLIIGAAITAVIVWGLGRWRNVWFARAVWAIHALRLPAMIGGAFFPDPAASLPPGFYLTGLVVVVINLWMLSRAAWDH